MHRGFGRCSYDFMKRYIVSICVLVFALALLMGGLLFVHRLETGQDNLEYILQACQLQHGLLADALAWYRPPGNSIRRTFSKPRRCSRASVASALRRTSSGGEPSKDTLGMRTRSHRSARCWLRVLANWVSACCTAALLAEGVGDVDMRADVAQPRTAAQRPNAAASIGARLIVIAISDID